MARHRRQLDWEAIIRAVGALIILLVGFGAFGGGLNASQAVLLIFLGLVGIGILGGLTFLLFRVLHHVSALGIRRYQAVNGPDEFATCNHSKEGIESALDSLDWFQLERLVARLFELKGNSVISRGGAHPDGGIDLVVQTDSSRAAVQCKHWSNWRCGPATVRELIGSMVHEHLPQGFLVCRSASETAKTLAQSHKIRIVERENLIERIQDALAKDDSALRTALFNPAKLCPKCGAQMVRRTTRSGKHPGSEFWGCSTYPACLQKLRI